MIKRLLLFSIPILLSFYIVGQENEYYRFSFDYFQNELNNNKGHRKYYLKEAGEWKLLENKYVIIDEGNDWKIVDEENNIVLGAFTEGGIYNRCPNEIYCREKQKWMHLYYKPIWEIKMSDLGFDLEYDMKLDRKNWLTDQELGEFVFDVPEIAPEFPGGIQEMFTFLMKSISYPSGIDAYGKVKVFVQFVVQKNGVISNVEIIRGAHKMLDDEVIRVIESMPNWIPARQKGKLVNSRFILPIQIELK